MNARTPPVLQLVPDKSGAGFTVENAGHGTKAQSKGPDDGVKPCTSYGGRYVLEPGGIGEASV